MMKGELKIYPVGILKGEDTDVSDVQVIGLYKDHAKVIKEQWALPNGIAPFTPEYDSFLDKCKEEFKQKHNLE